MKLTVEQQEFATANMGLAGSYVKVHSPRWLIALYVSYEEAYQVCCVGLLHAVLKYRSEAGEFSTYAFKCMHNELLAGASHQHMVPCGRRSGKFNLDVVSDEQLDETLDAPVDDTAAEWFATEGQYLLTDDQRQVTLLRLEGYSAGCAAAKLGISKRLFFARIAAAASVLRRALCDR